MKISKNQSEKRLYSSNSFKIPSIRELVAVIHAFSGCDTTSAFFRQGKVNFFKHLEKNKSLQMILNLFNEPDADSDSNASAGQRLIQEIYLPNAKPSICFDELRYFCSVASTKNKNFDLAALPPTSDAARQHSLRVYHQVQQWRGNVMDPEEWGWRRNQNGLIPITTTKVLIPKNLLKAMSCACTGLCEGRCGCRALGLPCSILCANCGGSSCSNVADHVTEDEHNDLECNETEQNIHESF